MAKKRTLLEIKHLYKIFGPEPEAALERVRAEGLGKSELMEQTNHVLALNDINTEVREGEITVMMGLSGSGKSTLIRHLNRLIEPTAGEILLDGEDVLALSQEQLRRMRRERMSMVFQNFALLPHRTVLDNAGMAAATRGDKRADYEKDARKWLDRVGLGGNADQYPHELSGGMQQRVGLARALASNSPIMLMDEAFSALDPLIRTDMQDLLLELQSELQKTVVFISHDLDEALKLADHLVILKDGFVVQQGEPQHILLEPEDDYIVDFVSDINRARVLRVRSVMNESGDPVAEGAVEVDHDDTLESVLSKSDGAMEARFVVTRDGVRVGTLDMAEVLKALVPAAASESGMRTQAT
ncbi:betaine/proline/choline family ABC transporter ATP-binding protein [Sinisalibacter lacisalsi]|uniref:Quaternary amine transport ATP-binding protein n=1 Tax=Sinisalibacter lacisalsi TaxID=1526570 RepID=A0ABQ1QJ16_9RHOB|nr:betaine/proline/choline family ABC transporter ATP-binding protein [Sinisalibacter lacisalsi]GGD28312.1 proline/glycine betaine ABC transporter ATP-binding protein [Sinisalibacter lacisalsi]